MSIRKVLKLIASPFVWVKCKVLKLDEVKAETVHLFNKLYGTNICADDYVVRASLFGGFNIYHKNTDALLALSRSSKCIEFCTKLCSTFYPKEFAAKHADLFGVTESVYFRHSKKVERIYSAINVAPLNRRVSAADDQDIYNDILIIATPDLKIHEIRKEAYDFSCMYSHRVEYVVFPVNTRIEDVFNINNNFILKVPQD